MNEQQSGLGGRPSLSLDAFAAGIRAGDRAVLARAITLVESRNPSHRALAKALLQEVLPGSGGAFRIGITGSPGVGKSTTIDQFGCNLIAQGHKLAVLAVDPTSQRTQGSILGDKTRMGRLAIEDNAFIRPSPSAGTLGGVTRSTRETMVLCEAAGFDVIIVETVGVGQSEMTVASMTDFFLVLLLPGAGDDLQGIKKGVLELADMIAINKADGENAGRASATVADYRTALHILTPRSANWRVPVIGISGLRNLGLDEMWQHMIAFRQTMTASGEWQARRRDQAVRWMHDLIEDRMRALLSSNPAVATRLSELEALVRSGKLLPTLAAEDIAAVAGWTP
jgi:LAO/AO transport system kinase